MKITSLKQKIHPDHINQDLEVVVPSKLGEKRLPIKLALEFQIEEELMLMAHA